MTRIEDSVAYVRRRHGGGYREGWIPPATFRKSEYERPAGRPLFCSLCKVQFQSRAPGRCSPEDDRIIPGAAGGEYAAGNVQWLCKSCNSWKGDRILSAADVAERGRWRHPCRLGCVCEN